MRFARSFTRGAIAVVSAFAVVSAALPAGAVGPPAVDWFVKAGAMIDDVALDGAGGVVVVGLHKRFATEHSGVIARYGPSGDLIWSDPWTPDRGFVYGLGLAVAPDGTVVAVGGIECEGWEATGAFVRSYTAGGQLRWSVITEGGWCEDAVTREKATDVAIAHGVVVVVGYSFGCCGLALDDGWIRAYDLDGMELWRRDFEVPGIESRTLDSVQAVAATSDGFVLTGAVNVKPGHDTATPMDSEIVLQSIDVTGAVGWTTVLRDRGVKDSDTGSDVAVSDGRILVVGAGDRSRSSAERGWIARFASDGTLRWLERWGRHTSVNGVAIGPDDIIWTIGEASDRADEGTDMLLRAYDPRGEPLWSLRRDPTGRWAAGSAIAPDDVGAFVTGSAGWKRDGGRLWRYVLLDPARLTAT
jgi:hypothetical protein